MMWWDFGAAPIISINETEIYPLSMVRLKEILSPSFKDYGVRLPTSEPDILELWQRCWSVESQFCKAVVNCGYLSNEQMVRAAFRYRLGASKNGGVIFWQIDHEERTHDGKVVYYNPDCHRSKQKDLHPTWVSSLLKHRMASLPNDHTSHCLFGLHLLREVGGEVCIVEAEKTAIIMSELYPDYLWLASGGLNELQPYKFHPLRGRKVILFPDTDPDGLAFKRWWDIAQEIMHSDFWEDSPPIYVSPLLEQKASPDQKSRKIDLVDFKFESKKLL